MSREIRSAFLGLFLVFAPFLPATLSSGAIGDPGDPSTGARFSIVIDGYEVGSFSELVGIRSGNDDILEIGGSRLMLPRSRTLPTVTLKRGQTSSMEMWAWHEAGLLNLPGSRRGATIIVYDTVGSPVARYHLTDAWPAKLEIGALKAGASSILMETVTIVCSQIQRVSP